MTIPEEVRQLQVIAGETALLWNRMYVDLLKRRTSLEYRRLFEEVDGRAQQVRGRGATKVRELLRQLLFSVILYSDATVSGLSSRGWQTLSGSIASERRRFVNLMRKLDPEWRPVPMFALPLDNSWLP